MRGLSTKWILHRAARELLPAELRKRPKAGFRLPLADWLRVTVTPLQPHPNDPARSNVNGKSAS